MKCYYFITKASQNEVENVKIKKLSHNGASHQAAFRNVFSKQSETNKPLTVRVFKRNTHIHSLWKIKKKQTITNESLRIPTVVDFGIFWSVTLSTIMCQESMSITQSFICIPFSDFWYTCNYSHIAALYIYQINNLAEPCNSMRCTYIYDMLLAWMYMWRSGEKHKIKCMQKCVYMIVTKHSRPRLAIYMKYSLFITEFFPTFTSPLPRPTKEH
jgi:hypothetical protein